MSRADTHETIERMLSAYLDDELTQAEAQRVELHLEECAACRGALEELRALQRLTSRIPFPPPPEEALERLAERLSVRLTRWGGWALLILGIVAWAFYGLYLILRHPRWPTAPELILGAIVIGLALVFVSVLRQRLLERPHDRYRRVRK